MTERIQAPRDRDALLEDLAELTTYGVAPVDAARRLGVSHEQLITWVKSRDTEARRRLRKRQGVGS